MKKIIYLIMFLFLLSSVSATDNCEWTSQPCDSDTDCITGVCVSKMSNDGLKEICDNTAMMILSANQIDMNGYCAKLWTETTYDGETIKKPFSGIGTLLSVKQFEVKEEKVECPTCEPIIEYVNVTLPAPEPVVEYKTNWKTTIYIMIFFILIGVLLLFVEYELTKRKFKKKEQEIKDIMNKNFNDKFGKKIEQFDKLKSFSPDFVKRETTGKVNASIKNLSVEEMAKKIKDSEGVKK